MNLLDQIKSLLNPASPVQTGEITNITLPTYTVSVPGGTIRVTLGQNVSAALSEGDWVAVRDGQIIAKVKDIDLLPTYYV